MSLALLTSRFSRQSWLLTATLLIAVIAAWPVLSEPGLLNTPRGGGDSPFLLQRLHQLETALLDGHFPVRWMPDANYGYGYPFYNYYAPLSIYIALLFRILGFSFVRAIQMAQLAGFITAAWAMFHLGRRWLGDEWGGLLTAVAYTFAPFHMANVYVRGDSLAEFWAMALYPLIILAADDLFTAPAQGRARRVRIGRLTLAYAALVYCHNISAMIFTPFLLLFILLRWLMTPQRQSPAAGEEAHGSDDMGFPSRPWLAGAAAFSLALGLALAAAFFLPALAEKSLAQLGPVTEGHFFYGNQFRGIDLIQSRPLFDYDALNGIAFRMGLVQALTAVAGLLVLLLPAKRRGTPRISPVLKLFLPATLLIATLMITPLSRPLWAHLPLLAFTQFPWRFLSVQALGTAVAAGALSLLPRPRLTAPLWIALLALAGLGDLHTDHLILTDADITAQNLAQYEWFTGNIGSTVSAEYLPQTMQPRVFTSDWLNRGERNLARSVGGELLSARLIRRKASRQTWEIITAPSGATVRFPTMFWPGWQAAVEGDPVAVRPSPGSGLIIVDVPPGEHLVTLRLGSTPVRRLAGVLSLIALLVTFWLLRPARRLRPSKRTWAVVAGLVWVALLLRLRPPAALPANDLTWDFNQMGYLHHDTEGVRFQNGALLRSYTLSHDVIPAGETLFVTLHWSAADSSVPAAVLALASPAVYRFEQAPLITGEELGRDANQVTYAIPIPEIAPAGLYVPRLVMQDGRPLTPGGRERGDLFLRPVRIRSVSAPTAAETADLVVRPIQVDLRGSVLDVKLAWLTRQPFNRNYNVSLRLIGSDGLEVGRFDGQPGYGFQPSSGWPVGQWVNEWLTLPLSSELTGASPYALVARLYDPGTGAEILTRRLGELTQTQGELAFSAHQPQFALPDHITPLSARFGGGRVNVIELLGYTLDQTEEAVHLTLYWRGLSEMAADYTRFVHLVIPDTAHPPLAQDDSMPVYNSYPTSQWTVGEVVTDPITLSFEDVPPGEYQLAAGWYEILENDRYPRLTAVNSVGAPLPDDRVLLPPILVVGAKP